MFGVTIILLTSGIFSAIVKAEIKPLDLTDCNNSTGKSCFMYPKNCKSSRDCEQAVTWKTESNGGYVSFEISRVLSNVSTDEYVAVGFNKDKQMIGASVTGCVHLPLEKPDVILMTGYNVDKDTGDVRISDAPNNMYKSDQTGILDGSLICRFQRLVNPGSKDSRILQLDASYYVLLAAGPALDDGNLTYHGNLNRHISDKKMLITNAGSAVVSATAPLICSVVTLIISLSRV